jgi:hypothetical protein
VQVTDAGIGNAANFSFNLNGDIVIPPFSTLNKMRQHGLVRSMTP